MAKARITVKLVYEYEIHPEDYCEDMTLQEMLEYDLNAFQDDFGLLLDMESDKFEVTGELIEDGEKGAEG